MEFHSSKHSVLNVGHLPVKMLVTTVRSRRMLHVTTKILHHPFHVSVSRLQKLLGKITTVHFDNHAFFVIPIVLWEMALLY